MTKYHHALLGPRGNMDHCGTYTRSKQERNYCTCMASSAENKSFCEVPKYVINTRPRCPKLMKFTCYTHTQSCNDMIDDRKKLGRLSGWLYFGFFLKLNFQFMPKKKLKKLGEVQWVTHLSWLTRKKWKWKWKKIFSWIRCQSLNKVARIITIRLTPNLLILFCCSVHNL